MKRLIVLLLMLVNAPWLRAQILTESNLPIVVIETDGGVPIPDEPRVYGNMKIIWHQDGSRNYLTDINNPQFLNYDGRISIETRGSTSQTIEKKPYGLTTLLPDDVSNNNVSILGMPEENDWILNNLAFDKTCMRDVLSYELYELMGNYATRRKYCEVMVNGDYKGLYVFLEKIKVDKNRVNIEKMDESCNAFPEVTGGYITKADKTTGGDPVAWTMVSNYSWAEVAYIHHYPKPQLITDAQHEYIKSVFFDFDEAAVAHDESLVTGYPSIIDIPSFIDYMLITEYISNPDGYVHSTFFHKERNGKLRAGPLWDSNFALGFDEWGITSEHDVWQFHNGSNEGSRFWYELFNSPTYRCFLAKRWEELTQPGQPLNVEFVNNRIDEIETEIVEGIYHDQQRWNLLWGHSAEVEGMKNWIQLRADWISSNIGSCEDCSDVDVPPLVISKIHYHPLDWQNFSGDRLEFIEITNNGDEEVDLTGVYFRELGITYGFPVGSTLAGREALVLCSDSLAFIEYYNMVPFGQFNRNLSNKSENLVMADVWGNIIDQVHYYDSDPWPRQADGEGYYLQLIDLDLDNSLPESWTIGNDLTGIMENTANEGFRIYPNPTTGIVNIVGAPDGEYRITNVMGQTLMTGPLNAVETRHGTSLQQIDVSLPTGLYFVEIDGMTQKLIVK
ncbi:MAG: CotH kinase family protein [Bacteroidales bacterium]|nr:CotH kinase family protein [Bacteroidales bacterium]